MKNLLVIAMALVSVSSFAAEHKMEAKKDAHKEAMEACKEHSKDKKAMEACMTEHMKAAPAATEVAVPAHK